jgi:hypothetical protein
VSRASQASIAAMTLTSVPAAIPGVLKTL